MPVHSTSIIVIVVTGIVETRENQNRHRFIFWHWLHLLRLTACYFLVAFAQNHFY